jgi:hypothetical protein
VRELDDVIKRESVGTSAGSGRARAGLQFVIAQPPDVAGADLWTIPDSIILADEPGR